MDLKTEKQEKKMYQIRQRIRDEFYFSYEVVAKIAERLLKELRWK